MKVSDLRFGKVDAVELKVTEKEEVKEFTRRDGSTGRVCNGKGEDDTGSIKIALWGDDIDKVDIGTRIKITNGFVKDWQGEKQISTGRYGNLEVLE